MNDNFLFLTDKQRRVYILRNNGVTYKKIAEDMNISYSMARQHYINAERRIREYEKYNVIKERNKKELTLDLTLGELIIIINSLYIFQGKVKINILHKINRDWIGKLPYEYYVLENLIKKVEATYKSIDI